MDTNTKLAISLKKYLTDKNLSLDALSTKSGIEKYYIKDILTCKVDPSLDILMKLCHSLDIELSTLIKEIERF
ncbi:hypothetical protein SH2C18_37770 [Clostridium sediminicola]|uniref:helix-turn-helix domain-containing protein n=1 Tax=Clostridium sediminicola TaxID=3114879 RepID=UPI0031F2328F